MTPAQWHVEWYKPFDASNDALEPADFLCGKSFATKAEADRYARRMASRALNGIVEIYEVNDDA